MGNKSSKQKLIEINNYYNSLNNFECCICFTEYIDKIERVKCKHSICKRCAFILQNNLCPICRLPLEILNKKNIQFYFDEPYNSHGDMGKKELIMQMDIMDISELDVKRIKKIIGNLAVVRFVNNDLIIHYFPYFNNLRIQTIKEFNIENNYLFITLIEDLEKQKYKIWYDNQDVYNRILNIIVF
jgi:hypothetical protein